MNTKTITQTGWVYFDVWRYGCFGYPAAEHWRFIAGTKLDLNKDTIPVCEVTITFDVPADFDHRGPQQPSAVSAFIRRIGIRKMTADVTQPCRAQNRIDDSVQKHISIGVPL